MGAQLVARAYRFGSQVALKPNEARLLMYMALTALDTDAEPKYFASREDSAFALGRDLANASPAEIASAFQQVKVAVNGLMDTGAITRVTRGSAGRRAEYGITLVPKERSTKVIPVKVRIPYPRSTKVIRRRYVVLTPKEPQEPQEKNKEKSRDPAPSHLHAVDNFGGDRIAV
jgi:hypothetical protein